MHRHLILLLVPACAACASGPVDSTGSEEVRRLARALRDPPPAGPPTEDWPEARLAALGDEALPALKAAIADAAASRLRERAARALGMMWSGSGHSGALEAYVQAVQAAPDELHVRGLLAQAFRFRDPEGRVLAILDTALQHMRVVTPEMVAAAAAMTDVEVLETLMKVVGRGAQLPSVPERDVALRYIGRAARRGRREAVEFLSACAQSANADLMEKAGTELKLLAGRAAPKSWRAWWFERASGERKAWLAESFAPVGGRPFDPGERDHLGELVARIPQDSDAEPELWFIEQALGRRFGYVSPRDVFDPDVDPAALAESNRRAIATAREWWRENSPYLFLNPATGRFDVSEEGRRIGVPVDPKTGKPGR